MFEYREIIDVFGREILDSRGNPTVEVEILADGGAVGRASVPSGASTGEYEAVELRDGEKRYLGKGVTQAVHYINTVLADAVIGENVLDQARIDDLLRKADGTENKRVLGANAILGISMAAAKTAAECVQLPLFQYLGGAAARTMPVPMMNILNGGCHADNTVDLQEFMIMPVGAVDFSGGLQMCAEVYHTLKKQLKSRGLVTSVGDEGGFAPDLKDSAQVLQVICESVTAAGYTMGKDIVIALDAASSELYDKEKNAYYFPGESKMLGREVYRTSEEMIGYYEELGRQFPIASIEDGLDQNDWEGWQEMTRRLGGKLQLVGDDLFVTNRRRLQQGIEKGAANAILVKVNQIGTLTEAFAAMDLARRSGYRTIVSHRSGETEDAIIADIAVAFGAGQIKTGAPCRGERTAKYNQLLRIEDRLGLGAVYENPFILKEDETPTSLGGEL